MEKILVVVVLSLLVVLFFYLINKNKNTECDIELPEIEECEACDNIFCHNKDKDKVKKEMKEYLKEKE